MRSWLTDRDRWKRFGTTLGTVWGLWVPLLAAPQVRNFFDAHPWIALCQGPAVATVTLMIGELGRRRAEAVTSTPTPDPQGGGT